MAQVDTKDRILDAAQKLFSEKGFADTSLREITAAAGVNLAAVNYHFGSKEGLLQPLVQRILGSINDKRVALLDELERQHAPEAVPLEAILRAFLIPLFECGTRDRAQQLIRLMGRLYMDMGDEILPMFHSTFEEVLERYPPAVAKSLGGDVEPGLVMNGFLFLIGSMIHVIGHPVSSSIFAETVQSDQKVALTRLVTYGAAGLRALVAAESSREVTP